MGRVTCDNGTPPGLFSSNSEGSQEVEKVHSLTRLLRLLVATIARTALRLINFFRATTANFGILDEQVAFEGILVCTHVTSQ